MTDFICYITLLALLIYMTRLRPGSKVSLKWGDTVLPGHVLKCEPGLMNRVGLLNTPALAAGDGLYLPGVKSIHTRGMHYPIDLLFLDDSKRILAFHKTVAHGQRRINGPKGTSAVLELGEGTIDRFLQDIALHQRIEVIYE